MVSICFMVRRKVCFYMGILSCFYLMLYFQQIEKIFLDISPRTEFTSCHKGSCFGTQHQADLLKENGIRKTFDKKSSSFGNMSPSSFHDETVMDITEKRQSINKAIKNNYTVTSSSSTLANNDKMKREIKILLHRYFHSLGKFLGTAENKTNVSNKRDMYLSQYTSTYAHASEDPHQLQPKRTPLRIVRYETNEFKPPFNEVPIRRLPQSIIIGFGKCGTRAILEYLSLHPYVVVHKSEMHFYDRDQVFEKGFDWYQSQMPLSYSNQITIEKTPAYILYQRARDEIYRLTPNVKLIVLVRDPVVRLVSHFMLRYRNILPFKNISVTAVYRNQDTKEFMPDHKPVVVGIYYRHFKMWLERFPREQFLILNGEELTANPLNVMKRVERYLDIPSMFTEWNFYFNKSSGFFCPRRFGKNAVPQCLGALKGVSHPKLPEADERMLYEFYRPFSEKFFQLVGQRFKWTEREWERYQ